MVFSQLKKYNANEQSYLIWHFCIVVITQNMIAPRADMLACCLNKKESICSEVPCVEWGGGGGVAEAARGRVSSNSDAVL